MKRGVLSFAFAGLVLSASFARAEYSAFGDPHDVAGRLDVDWVAHGHLHTDAGRLLKHVVKMFRGWGKRQLRGPQSFINIFFNTDGDTGFERRLNIDVRDGRLRALMTKFRSGERVGIARHWHPTSKRIAVMFSPELLGSAIDGYEWIVLSIYHRGGDGPCGTRSDVVKTCIDRVPNRGRVVHQL